MKARGSSGGASETVSILRITSAIDCCQIRALSREGPVDAIVRALGLPRADLGRPGERLNLGSLQERAAIAGLLSVNRGRIPAEEGEGHSCDKGAPHLPDLRVEYERSETSPQPCFCRMKYSP